MAPHANVDEPSPIPEVAVDAGLTTISIGKLMSGDESTQKQLLRAATDLGFFYLDVRDHPSGQLISRIDQVTSTALEFYALPQEQKSEWEVNKDHTEGEEIIMGYKPAGIQTGPVAGKSDGFEGFLIFEHALSAAPQEKPINGPEIFQKKRKFIEAINDDLSEIGRTILASVSQSLKLEGDIELAAHHRKNRKSPTALGLLKYLPYTPGSEKVGHISHTDIGSLSMVFSEVGGLQVYHPEKKSWMYIAPKPGHTVCNIGDSVEFMSRGVLRSSLHRVIPHPAEKDKIKMTVVYLMRPETDTVFLDRDGKEWKSVDWHNMKNRLFTQDLESQASTRALTGRLGHGDLWDETESA